MKRIIKASLVLTLLFVFFACTTQKSRSDMSALGELYHNTTAHYNGYFNAEEILAASIESLNEQHQDNYTKLLPMFEYVAAENPQSEAPNLDEAIKKVTVVVNLHRYSKWTDDCYLLVGKAQYLKQDYEAAEETLRFLAAEYSPEKMKEREKVSKQDKKVKKKKKKRGGKKGKKKSKKTKLDKEKARALKQYQKAVKKAKKKGAKAPPRPEILKRKSEKEEQAEEEMAAAEKKKEEAEQEDKPGNNDGFLKHRPAYQEGLLWLARTMIERDKYDAAQAYIGELENSMDTYSDIRGQLQAVKAYYHIHRQDYVQALPALEDAIDAEKDKKQRARYAFIMAQIFQMNGNASGAYASFQQALKMKPGYEMEFNCKLNMALNEWASGSGSAYDARENLAKLLKDSKNADYQDQIYFALAQIALKNGDREEAIKNLELSLQNSRQNQAQRAESYLTLASLYYEVEDYVRAKNYYDSTLLVIAETDNRYARVKSLSSNLTDIAANIQVIELQDSLLRISRMSNEEKEALALAIKKEQDEQRRQKIAAKAGTPSGFAASRRAVPGGALQKESTFFAYDDRSIKRGQREFERKWGGRPLEDNWRRSSKRDATAFEEEGQSDFFDSNTDILTEEEISRLLGNVPKTEGEVAVANLKIQEAMFNLGALYRERLENMPKAIEMFETLNSRYPSNNYELDSWFQMYLIYDGLGNVAKAQEYADKILEKYQTSKYAMVIKNPAYVEELEREGRLLNNYYNETYAAFTSGNYREAYDKSISAKEKFGPANAYQPKFALLAAMSTGNLEGKDAYVEALRNVVARYPDTDEQRRAKEILRLLGEASASLPGGARQDAGQFKAEDDALHYVVVVFKNKDIDLNKNKIIVSDYNEKFHKLDRLRISNIYLGTDAESRLPILVMRRFKDKADAMKYYTGIQKNSADFIPQSEPHEVFPVTQNNYREILKEKSVDGYRAFFELNYLK
ncbi:MAG: tetratricopeptide repeat protein [Phaeodactylibacter sp.]|nr:tetratricopeptide repeat protein [Phaeodactylibacter sp.]